MDDGSAKHTLLRTNVDAQHASQQQKHNYRHLQTDNRSVGTASWRARKCAAEPLENQDAWGTGKNDQTLRGCMR